MRVQRLYCSLKLHDVTLRCVLQFVEFYAESPFIVELPGIKIALHASSFVYYGFGRLNYPPIKYTDQSNLRQLAILLQ